MPSDASNVLKAKDLPWIQKSFEVDREPRKFAVSPDALKRAAAGGWKVCSPTSSEWVTYEDASVNPPRHTTQMAYALYKENVLVLLIGRHYSDAEGLFENNAPSAKLTQHGMVIARNATLDEVKETVETLTVTCE